MLAELARLVEAITEESSSGKNSDARLAALLAMEVRARLELESALRQYLSEAPSNPFKASADLLEFLDNDRKKESYGN